MAAVDRFQNDSTCRLFIGNLKAGGVGLNLTAACNLAVIEFGWTPTEHSQVEDRINRIGQMHRCMIWYLIGANTYEHRICELLDDKQFNCSAVLDGGSGKADLNLFDMIDQEFSGKKHVITEHIRL